MSERSLLLGYDLCDGKSQLAVYNRETLEPELVGRTEENPDALFDTSAAMEDGTVFRHFLPVIRQGGELAADGESRSPVDVLAHFFQKTLSMTRQEYPSETIKYLVVTVPDQSAELTKVIYEALETLGIGKDRAMVIGHKQSFLYFALYQKKELWVNDAGMFDYSDGRLVYYQMQIDRRKSPVLVGLRERDYTDAMELAAEDGPEGRAAEPDKKAAVFEDVALGAIHKQILSALYMTGNGFDDSWADAVFRRLCVGRRLFKGNNLYVSGACYAAKEFGETQRLSEFLLMGEDMITSHICLTVYAEAREQEQVLVRAGTPWYQVDSRIDLIPDGDSELAFCARNIFTKEKREFLVDLDAVAGKRYRQCRLTVRVRFADVHTCIITVKDCGFGDLFPTSNRIWEKTIRMDAGGDRNVDSL